MQYQTKPDHGMFSVFEKMVDPFPAAGPGCPSDRLVIPGGFICNADAPDQAAQ